MSFRRGTYTFRLIFSWNKEKRNYKPKHTRNQLNQFRFAAVRLQLQNYNFRSSGIVLCILVGFCVVVNWHALARKFFVFSCYSCLLTFCCPAPGCYALLHYCLCMMFSFSSSLKGWLQQNYASVKVTKNFYTSPKKCVYCVFRVYGVWIPLFG